MDKYFVIYETYSCECGYPHDAVFGIYGSKEEAEQDFKILARKDEIQGTHNYRLVEKEVTKPSLQPPTYLKYVVLYDDEKKIAHLFGAPSFVNEQTECIYSNDRFDVPLQDGNYHEFKRAGYKFIPYSPTLSKDEFENIVKSNLINEGWKVVK